MVNLLLAKGANINAFDKKDRHALHWAAYMGEWSPSGQGARTAVTAEAGLALSTSVVSWASRTSFPARNPAELRFGPLSRRAESPLYRCPPAHEPDLAGLASAGRLGERKEGGPRLWFVFFTSVGADPLTKDRPH